MPVIASTSFPTNFDPTKLGLPISSSYNSGARRCTLHCRSRLATLFAYLLFTTSALAQITGVTDDQSTPVPGVPHDYVKLLSETVNPANGAVSVRITVPVPDARKQPMPFSINYDSNGTAGMSVTTCAATGISPCPTGSTTVPYAAAIAPLGMYTTGGWTYGTTMLTHTVANIQKVKDPQIPTYYVCFFDTNYVFQDPSGGRHPLSISYVYDNQPDCAQFSFIKTSPAAEGTVYQASLTDLPLEKEAFWQITGSDGTAYTFPQNATTPPRNGYPSGPPLVCDANTNPCTIYSLAGGEDSNGNIFSASVTNLTVPPYTSPVAVEDDLERGFTAPALGSNGAFTVPGLTGSYSIAWGTESGRTVSAPITNVGTDTHCTFVSKTPSEPAISSITLPNGQSYTFLYDSTWGTIKQITYPTGGWVKYTWNWNLKSEAANFPDTQPGNPPTCEFLYATPVVTQRTVSYDGTNVALTQKFSYQTLNWSFPKWGTKQTTVSTTDNVRGITSSTTYTYSGLSSTPGPNQAWSSYFGGQIPIESTIVYNDFNGQTLKTVYKGWNTSAQPELPVCELEQLDSSGPISATFYSYEPGPQGGYPIGDAITDKKEYDYGLITSTTACSNNGTAPNITPTRETVTNYQAFTNTPLFSFGPSILDRPCQIIKYGSNGTTQIKLAETDYFYDNGGTGTPCGAAGTPSVASAGGSSITEHDSTNYSSSSPPAPRGNVTTKIDKCFPLPPATQTCSDAGTTYAYDETGQVVSRTDANGNSTTYSYADNFFSTDTGGFTNTGGSPPSGMVTNAYLTKITRPVTNGVNHIEKFSYGFNNGELTKTVDENSQTTTYQYNESLGQPTQTNFPDGGQVSVSYNDVPLQPTVTTSTLITSSLNLASVVVSDGLGHQIQTQTTTDPDGTDYADVKYDGTGKVWEKSNPHRSGSSTTDGTTTNYYDALGRVCLVVPPDGTFPSGATCPTSRPTGDAFTTYSGNCTTVTDEAGNSRTMCSDALGRLIQVFEDPAGLNYETDYTYNALGVLLTVNQKGTAPTDSTQWRTRTFTYDSLARLLSANNPESGTVQYTYDGNGNVTSKVAPQPNQTGSLTVTTNYQYDALNRLLNKSYVGMSTSSPSYGYDGIAQTGCSPPPLADSYAVGRRTAMCDGSGATSWAHDTMDRIITESRKVSTTTRTISYGYNLAGSLASLTYPTGRKVTYAYAPSGSNSAGRAVSAIDSTGPINYVSAAHYAPPGALTSMTMGSNPITVTNAYNERLQPVLLSASTSAATILSLCYDFHLGVVVNIPPCNFTASSLGDNGNVFQVVNNRDNNRTQSFMYDSLNRITQAYTSGPNWGQTFSNAATAPGVQPTTPGVDAWGNLTNVSGVTGKGGAGGFACPANTQNQLTACSLTYDAAGNVTNNSGAAYTYDAENRIVNAGGATYLYDGDGNRVARVFSTGNLYWRDLNGNTLLEDSDGGTNLREYIYFNGQRVARRDVTSNTVHYMFSDHLGSTSLITDALGTMSSCNGYTSGQFESDYYPYGGEIPICAGLGDQNYKFDAKERDAETGLDYFGARHYASSLGRFMIPDWAAKPTDVPYANFGNPQSLNLYSYVENNPTTLGDVDGHCDDSSFLCNLGTGILIGLYNATSLLRQASTAYYNNQAPPADQVHFAASIAPGNKAQAAVAAVTMAVVSAGVPEEEPVEAYELGTYGDLASRSVKDGLSIDHIPSNASNLARAAAEKGGPLTEEEAKTVFEQGTAVAVPDSLHRGASPTYGGRNSAAQIQADAANPRAAAVRDLKAMIKAAKPSQRAAAKSAAKKLLKDLDQQLSNNQ